MEIGQQPETDAGRRDEVNHPHSTQQAAPASAPQPIHGPHGQPAHRGGNNNKQPTEGRPARWARAGRRVREKREKMLVREMVREYVKLTSQRPHSRPYNPNNRPQTQRNANTNNPIQRQPPYQQQHRK